MRWKSLMIATMVAGGLGLAGCDSVSDQGAVSVQDHRSADIMEFHAGLMVLDSHLDTPAKFHQSGYKFDRKSSWAEDGSHVDLYRMNEGGLDGGFWVIYIPQGPLNEAAFQAVRNAALMRQTAIREFAARYNEHVELAFVRDDADRAAFETGETSDDAYSEVAPKLQNRVRIRHQIDRGSDFVDAKTVFRNDMSKTSLIAF